ncbi:hypothetical protein ACFE04_027879 [Oxalis oulophora]
MVSCKLLALVQVDALNLVLLRFEFWRSKNFHQLDLYFTLVVFQQQMNSMRGALSYRNMSLRFCLGRTKASLPQLHNLHDSNTSDHLGHGSTLNCLTMHLDLLYSRSYHISRTRLLLQRHCTCSTYACV